MEFTSISILILISFAKLFFLKEKFKPVVVPGGIEPPTSGL